MPVKTASSTAKALNLHRNPPIILPKKPKLLIASDIIPREMTWLWYPYIPSGSASLLFGPGGGGKSHITVDIAARLTAGVALPGQENPGKSQKVLMLSAEDDFDVVLVPRLMKAGARLDYVGLPEHPFTLDKRGLEMVAEYMQEFAATVVFIDPIVHYMGGKIDMNRANEVRSFMGELHQMAMKKQSAVIVVGHSRKPRADSPGEDWEQIMGSADFSNAVRSVLFVTKANDGTRVMRHAKANYSALGETLAFEFGDNGFQWTGAIDEGGMLTAAPLHTLARRKTKVEAWIRKLLSEGPVRALDIPTLAKDAGFSMATVNRAKPGLAESLLRYINGKPVWYWKLSDNEGDEDDVQVQGLEDGGSIRGRVPGEAPGRRSAGGRVDPKPGGGTGTAVRKLGVSGSAARKDSAQNGTPEGPPQDPKTVAAAFLASLGTKT